MEKTLAVTLILMTATAAYCDRHSLRFYYMGVSAPGSGLPEFFKVGYVDDKRTWLYSSNTGRAVPVASWMEKVPEYWLGETKISKGEEALFRSEVKIAMKRFNHTDVRPGVKVTGRESGEITKLHCLVYGFHPRAVDVKWMKNGVDEVPTYETTHVLPNPDGTYQIRVTVEVIAQEGDSYSCYVDHSSLEEPLLVKWEPKQEVPLSVLISVGVISVLLITSVIAGVIIYKKKDGCRRPPS